MKRFWKLLSLTFITLVTISVFFIQTAASSHLSFQVGVKDIEGNRQVLEDTVIAGSIHSNNFGYRFNLNQDSVEFEQDDSYLAKLDNSFDRTETIQRYHEDYRHFMRGKIDEQENFYEDEESVVYAKDRITNHQYEYTQTIEISRLNKETKETENFSYSPKLGENSQFFYVRDVYYDDHLLTVLIQQPSDSVELSTDEFQLYIWNFETETMDLEGKKVHFPLDSQYNVVQTLPHSSTSDQTSYIGFIANTGGSDDDLGEFNEPEEDVPEEERKTHFFILDYHTLKMTAIETTVEITEAQNLQGLVTEDSLYVYKSGEPTSLLSTDLTTNKPTLTPVFPNANDTNGEKESEEANDEEITDSSFDDSIHSTAYYSFAEVHDNKFYFVSLFEEDTTPMIEVFDLDSKEKLYAGTLEVNQKDRQATASRLEVYINNLHFNN